METVIFKNESGKASEIIKRGGLVAVPTETVYGLAANGLDADAVEKIYECKGRPSVKPLSLMVAGAETIKELCLDVPEQAYALAERFWPGPLTIVLKARDNIPPIVLAGGNTVGLRCPKHEMTLSLLKDCALPLAAPSANPSGEESPKSAERVIEYFNGKIDAVIDGGECALGLESSIIDMTCTPYKILRQGALPQQDIENALVDRMVIVGISGGTGCGKTTALKELEKMGALVFDCDDIYKKLLESSRPLIDELERNFKGVTDNGRLDRKRLGAVVFKDKSALERLNKITHTYVVEEINRRLRSFAMQGGTLAAIDAIELFSSGLNRLCRKTLAVLSDRELRAERIMKRDSISREYALMRIDAQHSDDYFKSHCDYIVYNNSGKEEYASECRTIFKEIITNG